MDAIFDTVIVGAGSAGCVLAARLSADPGHRVLLLEAGPDFPDAATLPPELADGTRLASGYDWGLRAEGGAAVPRGRLVGGCSAINACFALRGHPGDYDAWASAGWSWSEVAAAFADVEHDLDFGARPGHGSRGELPVRRYADEELTPLHHAFLDAAVAAGHPWVDDHNAPGAVGAGRLPTNCVDGRRISCALAFLAPARSRPNLCVRAGALVDRVELAPAGHATGVRLADGERIAAGRVILSAGAYASPAILLRGGIGAVAELAGAGIAPVHELPGVGHGLADHVAVSVDFVAPTGWPLAPVFQSVVTVHSPGVDPAWPPDLQIVAGGAYADRSSPTGRVASVFAALVRPASRGRVWLRDADPASPPRIDLGHLRQPADVAVLADGVRRALPIARAIAAGPVAGPPDGDMRDWLRGNCWTYHHPVGTCAMGPDPAAGAVVDPAGRVHGIERLFVADASVMPGIPSANTNLPTVMLAHKLARALG